MAMYLLFGKYSAEGLKGISAKRSEDAKALFKKHGGELKAAYATLGGVDLVMIADLPDNARDGGFDRAREIDRHRLHHRARTHGRRVRQARGVIAAVIVGSWIGHSGTPQRGGPGIQKRALRLGLDSGFAPYGAPRNDNDGTSGAKTALAPFARR